MFFGGCLQIVQYLRDVVSIMPYHVFVGCLQIVQYLQDVVRMMLCHVFVGCFQIVQYLRDVVTATQSMSTVNASITTMGYSSEGREINVIKVREPPRMNRSIFKHVICNG